MRRLIVGISGSTGVIYGIRMLEVLKAVGGVETHLVMSRFARMNVEIETDGELTRGRTVADVYGVTGRPVNTDVALEADNPLFKDLILRAIKALDRR